MGNKQTTKKLTNQAPDVERQSRHYNPKNPSHQQFINKIPLDDYIDVMIVGTAHNTSYDFFINHRDHQGVQYRSICNRYHCSFYINQDSDSKLFAIYSVKTEDKYEKLGSKYDILFIDDIGIGSLEYHFRKVINDNIWEYRFMYRESENGTPYLIGTRREVNDNELEKYGKNYGTTFGPNDGYVYKAILKRTRKYDKTLSLFPDDNIASEIPWNSYLNVTLDDKLSACYFFGLTTKDDLPHCYAVHAYKKDNNYTSKGDYYTIASENGTMKLKKTNGDGTRIVIHLTFHCTESEKYYLKYEKYVYIRGYDTAERAYVNGYRIWLR